MNAPVRRANVIGTGLVGGSIGLALREQGWLVSGTDASASVIDRAIEIGAVACVGLDAEAELTFVATPVGAAMDHVQLAMESTSGFVTDVGSVKAPLVGGVNAPRFVGGHPMAGSEQSGIDGARADLFDSAVWVLTPGPFTADHTLLSVRSVVAALGAEVVVLPANRHDELVAVVSHVPHLVAASLMRLASGRAEDQQVLMRLAAGGFRDMTRIASGSPDIWPDICSENSVAIGEVLDELIERLDEVRQMVAGNERKVLLDFLGGSQLARQALLSGRETDAGLTEFRIPIPDRTGVLAEIATLATDAGVNIVDIEIAHSTEGARGVLILVVSSAGESSLGRALSSAGHRFSTGVIGG